MWWWVLWGKELYIKINITHVEIEQLQKELLKQC